MNYVIERNVLRQFYLIVCELLVDALAGNSKSVFNDTVDKSVFTRTETQNKKLLSSYSEYQDWTKFLEREDEFYAEDYKLKNFISLNDS